MIKANPAPLTKPVSQDAVTEHVEDQPDSEAPYTGLSLERDLFLEVGPDPTPEATGTDDPFQLPRTPSVGPNAPTESAPASTVSAQSNRPLTTIVPPDVRLKPADVPAQKLQPSSSSGKLRQASRTEAGTTHPDKKRPAGATSKAPRSKIEQIAAREGSGLKGFCPVALRDQRGLVEVSDKFSTEFEGKRYLFSSAKALRAFMDTPERYAPANSGNDVIHLALTGEKSEGSLEYAVWYKGRLYLFTSAETMETFVAAPGDHIASN